ncbi:MAG: hypothetical protein IKO27_07275 [Ruminococcus sp.]|nr:hypothetical protein [Ruminococcus sp.]
MKNTRTNKKAVKKNNQQLIAGVAGVAAAAVMGAGLMFVAFSVSPSNKPVADTPVAVSAEAAPTIKEKAAPIIKEKTAPAAEQKAEPAAEQKAEPAAEQKAEPAAEQKTAPAAEQQAEPTAEQQAAPAAEQKAEPAAEQKAEPAAEQKAEPAAEQQVEPAAEQEKILTVPEGEINDWKTHEAKDGFPVGTYFEKTNNNSTLNVTMVNSYTYKITVTIVTGDKTANVYDLTAIADGSRMFYENGTKTSVVYDDDHNVTESKLVDNTHKGAFDASDVGYTWEDSEGTTVFIPWIGYR